MTGNSKGITLVELLVASALYSLVAIAGYQLVISLIKGQEKNVQSASFNLVADAVIEELHRRVTNAVLLDPPEGLEIPTDSMYPGVSGLRAAVTGCVYDPIDSTSERFSILRFTSFDYKISPESTYQPWNDNDMATIELRTTYHAPGFFPPHAFQDAASSSPEVFLIDADKLTMRRYLVAGDSPVIDTTLHPYDDLPRGGELFSYHKLSLTPTRALNGASQAASGRSFIAGSFVYPVHTYFVCKSAEGKVVMIEEATGTVKTLIDPAIFHLQLDKMEFRYYGTVPGQRLDLASFALFPFSNTTARGCLNNLSMEMQFSNPTNAKAKIESFRELIPLSTFNTRRPAGCL